MSWSRPLVFGNHPDAMTLPSAAIVIGGGLLRRYLGRVWKPAMADRDETMRRLLLPLLLAATPLGAEDLLPSPPALPAWMAGTWAMQDGANWTDEIWTDPRGGLMIGLGRNGFGPTLDNWEVMRIEAAKDGRVTFIAQPRSGTEVRFPAVLASAEAIEFANPAHDYPQRIRYSRQGKLLIAEISMLDGSKAKRWQYRPVIPPQDQQ